MANLKTDVQRLKDLLNGQYTRDRRIMVFAPIPHDKPHAMPFPTDYNSLPYKMYIGLQGLETQHINNLGELNALCKKKKVGLDILPCEDLIIWEQVEEEETIEEFPILAPPMEESGEEYLDFLLSAEEDLEDFENN